jgi:hypothetical protein
VVFVGVGVLVGDEVIVGVGVIVAVLVGVNVSVIVGVAVVGIEIIELQAVLCRMRTNVINQTNGIFGMVWIPVFIFIILAMRNVMIKANSQPMKIYTAYQVWIAI